MLAQGDTYPLYMEVLPRLDKDLADLERLKESKDPPLWHIRARARAVTYLMGETIGKRFGSAIWREEMM